MPVLSRRGRLAIAAVIDIAIHARTGPVSAKALAARNHLPPRHLEPMLQQLVRVGILKGMRGPRGGYDLARERARITCADIVRSSLSSDAEEFEALSPLVASVVCPAVSKAEDRYFDELARITLADLCEQAERLEAVPEAVAAL
ncbi:RrF2 family transcriptional regulator [Phreatobacter sp.]|uniref:RrF2 family transcriptional regulator n=1 Tax=Phreatobacter sp. TaxID=1966341 RepID=UPI003F71A0F6